MVTELYLVLIGVSSVSVEFSMFVNQMYFLFFQYFFFSPLNYYDLDSLTS